MTPLSRVCLFAIVCAAGCGIPEEVHTQTLRDLEKCRQDLSLVPDSGRVPHRDRDPGRANHHEQGTTESPSAAATKDELTELDRLREAALRRKTHWMVLERALTPLAQSAHVQLTQRKGRMAIEIPETMLFESGKADVRPEARTLVAQITAALKEVPERDILVAGHTAAVPASGKFRSNWELSTLRAVALVKALQSQGLDPRRLGAVGSSEFEPLDGFTSGPAGRMELLLLPSPAEMPPLLERPATAPTS